MFNSRFTSLSDLRVAFPTEQSCIDYLEETRLPKSTSAKIINIAVKTQENTSMLKQKLFFKEQGFLWLVGLKQYGRFYPTKKAFLPFS